MHDGQHRWVVDAIEEHAASIEVDGKNMITHAASGCMPDGAKQGDVLSVRHDRPREGSAIDADDRRRRGGDEAGARRLGGAGEEGRDAAKDPGGDITL